jgi:hypothetical protein
MDAFMAENRNLDASAIDDLRSEFLRVLSLIEGTFGEHAFARYQPDRAQWRHQVVAAIYDAEMLAAQNYTLSSLAKKSDAIADGLKKLFAQKKFRDATEAATNATTAFRYRVAAIDRLLKRHSK